MKRTSWLGAVAALSVAGTAFAQTGNSGPTNPAGEPSQGAVPNTDGSAQQAPQPGSVGENSSVGAGKAQQQEQHGSAPKQGTSFAANQIVGQIKSVDRSSKGLTIEQAGKPQELKLSDNATVFMNGRLGSFEDLREGQQVRAAYEERGGQKTLRWIEVTPSTGAGRGASGSDKTAPNSGVHAPEATQPSPDAPKKAPEPAPDHNDAPQK